MFVVNEVSRCELRQEFNVPANASRHFTPKGVSIRVAFGYYKHSTTTWLIPAPIEDHYDRTSLP